MHIIACATQHKKKDEHQVEDQPWNDEPRVVAAHADHQHDVSQESYEVGHKDTS